MAGAVAALLAGTGLQWLLDQGCAALKARCGGRRGAEPLTPEELAAGPGGASPLRWLGALLDVRTGLPQVDTVLRGASAVVGLCEVALIVSDWWQAHQPLVAGALERTASRL